ncbi:MAG: ATP-dependent helicase [Gammaproteobacteria bacterium]|nr:ATP-dependent helicase [Gammaproteobacteria bacterium]
MNLSSTQQKIVRHGEGALLAEAGLGSGKTRVLTERIRRLLNESEGHFHVLALTFTNKAANEMRERLEEFPDIHQRAFIGTLHSFCAEVLNNRGKAVGIEGLPNIFENFQDRKQVLREAVQADPELASELKDRGKKQDQALGQWLNAISEAKRQLLAAEAVDDALLSKIYLAYDEGLRHSNAVDYDDLLLLTYQLFVERPKIANFYRRLYRYICVDEAQDLNEAQYRLLQALCGDEYRNVMLVGDPKQAIFQWNGGHPKYLDLFERNFAACRITMNENYRSSAAIVNIAKKLAPEYKPEGEFPVPGEINLLIGGDEQEEAEKTLNYLDNLCKNGHLNVENKITLERCAVLARNRYVFNKLEKLLKEKGWSYYKQLSTQHESESDLLQDFELCLRLLSNPQDRLHLNTLLHRWKIEKSILDNLSPIDCNSLIQHIEMQLNKPAQKIVLEAVRETGSDSFRFLSGLDVLETYANQLSDGDEKELPLRDIQQWRTHWDAFLRNRSGGGPPSPRAFLGQVALGSTQQPKQDGLALLTVHSAKGLEFDVVAVMGMMEGVFPDYRAVGESLREEKRNLFVAATRSKRLLCFSYAENKMMPWGDSKRQSPSRFLREIGLPT